MVGPLYQEEDREGPNAPTWQPEQPGLRDSETSRMTFTQNVESPEEPGNDSDRAVDRDVKQEFEDSEPLRTRIASELKVVERLQRTARPLALVVFTLLGLLAALQLYTWTRLQMLTTLGQQRAQREADVQATLQETIEKQQAALDRVVQQMAFLHQGYPKASLPRIESADPVAAPAVQMQLQHTKANRKPQPDHRAGPSREVAQPAADPKPPATAAKDSSLAMPALPHDSTLFNQDPPATSRELATSGQGTSPPPASLDHSAHQVPETTQNERLEGAGTSGMKFSQPDTVIARDHAEIEKLRKLGKRDYVEFTLDRSDSLQEVAPDISLQLRKVDSKRLRCGLNIYAEGYKFPVDMAINKAVVFPVRAMWESVELVVNKMGKDTVMGYLSARKGVLVTDR